MNGSRRRLQRALYTGPLLLLLVFATSGCAKTPPNLAPKEATAFRQTQVIHYLDAAGDAAYAAHQTVPPLISAPTALKIVNWHTSAVKIVVATGDGWKAAVLVSMDEVLKGLPPNEVATLTPYFDAAKLVIQVVQQ